MTMTFVVGLLSLFFIYENWKNSQKYNQMLELWNKWSFKPFELSRSYKNIEMKGEKCDDLYSIFSFHELVFINIILLCSLPMNASYIHPCEFIYFWLIFPPRHFRNFAATWRKRKTATKMLKILLIVPWAELLGLCNKLNLFL